MLRNMLCTAMTKKINNLIYEFDNLLQGYQILRENIIEKEVSVLGDASCSVSDFYSLMISFQALLKNTCKKDFLNYVKNEDDVRTKYIKMNNERESLNSSYQAATQNILELDSKLKETTKERDTLITLFEELKEMLFDGSFHKVPPETKQKITSLIDSFQRASVSSLPLHHLSQDVISIDLETEFPMETNHSILSNTNDASSVDCDKTEIFIPESARAPPSKLVVPDNDDVHYVNSSDSDSDQVEVTDDVKVITLTWDQMTDKSSDGEDYRATRRKRKAKSKPSAFPKYWWTCKICGRQFTNKQNLKRHENLHTVTDRPKQFLCAICHKSYFTNGDLNRHMRIHSNERFYCPTCGKSFTQNATLQRHIKIHFNIREFVCNDCNKSYTSKWALKAHIVMKLCPFVKKPNINHSVPDKNKKINYTDSVNNHYATSDQENNSDCVDLISSPEHHQTNDDEVASEASIPIAHESLFRVFKCDNCYKTFSRRDSLLRHKRTHNRRESFSCSDYPIKSPQPLPLKRHQTNQTNQKQYICSICQKAFYRKDNRDSHFKKHGIKHTYACENCKKSFISKHNLTLHISSNTCL